MASLVEYLLLEYNKDKIISKSGHKILQAVENDTLYLNQINGKEPNVILDDVFNKFDSIDPTPTQKYVPWLIREYSNGRMQMSDLPAMERYLDYFKTLAPRLKNQGISADLNQYTRHQLMDMIDKVNDSGSDEKEDSNIDKMLGNINPDEVDILYKGPWGILAVPKTENASCVLGHGTRWCTAATEYSNQFKYYHDKGYTLYIWRGKGGVAQFCFESMEFMDEDDKPLSKEQLDYYRKKNPITSKLFRSHEDKIVDDPKLAYEYANYALKGRWPEAEKYIMKNPETAYLYARQVIKGRWPEVEKYIKKDPIWAYWFAKNIIFGRFYDAEPFISQDRHMWARYRNDFLD